MPVDARTETVAHMVRAASKGRDLMGGTDAMQAAGELRLPRFEVEQIEDYAARLHSSWLFNGFKKTVKDMTGRVFEKPVEIADAPQQVIEWAENIDMQGRDLSAFAKEVFQDGFASGVSFIMADAPRRDAEATREQANTLGLRPYLVHLRVEDVLGWKTETYGNVLAFSQFRIMESYEYDDPRDEFMQVTGEQVRVLDSDESGVSVRIYRKDEGKNWVLFEQYPTDAQEITVVPYYAQRTGFATGEPVLEDLADVNLAHWRSQSDQTNVLHYARVPIVHVAGLEDGEVFKISANTAFVTRNHEAKVSWINFDDKAIKVGRQDLKDLEYQMQVMGLQLLVDGQRSATGSVLDAKKETSGLGMMADNLKDALEHALAWVADYGGLGEQSIGLVVNKDFGAVPLTAQEVTAMQKDVALGLLSREEYYEERKRRGVLRSDLDTEADIELVDNAEPDLGGGDGDE